MPSTTQGHIHYTGFQTLDNYLNTGMHEGIMLVTGEAESGKSRFALKVIAEQQRAEVPCAYIDLDAYVHKSVLEHYKVDTNKLQRISEYGLVHEWAWHNHITDKTQLVVIDGNLQYDIRNLELTAKALRALIVNYPWTMFMLCTSRVPPFISNYARTWIHLNRNNQFVLKKSPWADLRNMRKPATLEDYKLRDNSWINQYFE